MLIRPCTETDLPAAAAIYAHHVRHGTGTFELDAPDSAEIARRHAEVRSRGLPWLVAQTDAGIAGFAYANWFRPRPAYRFFVEDSVYLDPAVQRRGIGRLLLAELIARCEDAGARQMVAVIGDADNTGSIGLHAALGFARTGVLRASGWKFGRWLDVVLMQRALGEGEHSAPRDTSPGAVPDAA